MFLSMYNRKEVLSKKDLTPLSVEHTTRGLHLPQGGAPGEGSAQKETPVCETQNGSYPEPSKHGKQELGHSDLMSCDQEA